MDIESKSFCIWVLFIHSSVLLCNALSVFKGQGPLNWLNCFVMGGE